MVCFIIAVIVHGGFVSHYTLIFTAERLDAVCVCVHKNSVEDCISLSSSGIYSCGCVSGTVL